MATELFLGFQSGDDDSRDRLPPLPWGDEVIIGLALPLSVDVLNADMPASPLPPPAPDAIGAGVGESPCAPFPAAENEEDGGEALEVAPAALADGLVVPPTPPPAEPGGVVGFDAEVEEEGAGDKALVAVAEAAEAAAAAAAAAAAVTSRRRF